MLNDIIEITLTASDREGLLPKLMLELGALGMVYSHDIINFDYEDTAILSFVCSGSTNCDIATLTQSLESIPNVSSVVNITGACSKPKEPILDSIVELDSITEFNPLRANDPLTDDVMHVAQQRLSETYGPTLDIIVSRAAKKSKSVGELFLLLSKNLNASQKTAFLKDIEGLDLAFVKSA